MAAGSEPYTTAVDGAGWHFTCVCACCCGEVREANSGCVMSRWLWLPPSTIVASSTQGHATADEGLCAGAWRAMGHLVNAPSGKSQRGHAAHPPPRPGRPADAVGTRRGNRDGRHAVRRAENGRPVHEDHTKAAHPALPGPRTSSKAPTTGMRWSTTSPNSWQHKRQHRRRTSTTGALAASPQSTWASTKLTSRTMGPY